MHSPVAAPRHGHPQLVCPRLKDVLPVRRRPQPGRQHLFGLNISNRNIFCNQIILIAYTQDALTRRAAICAYMAEPVVPCIVTSVKLRAPGKRWGHVKLWKIEASTFLVDLLYEPVHQLAGIMRQSAGHGRRCRDQHESDS